MVIHLTKESKTIFRYTKESPVEYIPEQILQLRFPTRTEFVVERLFRVSSIKLIIQKRSNRWLT